jgi:hypothetical protein
MNQFILKAILLVVSIFPINTVYGQIIKTKLDFVAGISAREYLHGGIRYQYTDITQIGFYFGGDVGMYSEIITTYAIDHMIHFGKHSYYSNRPPWYARQGYTFAKSIESDRTMKFSYINLSLGREFAINDWLGFNTDLGIIAQVREKTELDSSSEATYKNKIQWMPLLRLQFFISL